MELGFNNTKVKELIFKEKFSLRPKWGKYGILKPDTLDNLPHLVEPKINIFEVFF